MLPVAMLTKMKLLYEDNMWVEAYTSDTAYPIAVDRLVACYEDHRVKNAFGAKLEKCTLIITDWSIIKDQDLADEVQQVLCSLFESGFEFYIWTGKLEKVTSLEELISKRRELEPVDPATVKEAVTHLDVPLLAKQCVILDYFKMRELDLLMQGKEHQVIPLEMNDVIDYMDEEGSNAIDYLIASFSGRERIIVKCVGHNSSQYSDYSGLFLLSLARSFPEKIVIQNINANEVNDDELILEDESIQRSIESIRWGNWDQYEESESRRGQLQYFQTLENLKSIHLVVWYELEADELADFEPYVNFVDTIEIQQLSSLPIMKYRFPNLQSLHISNLTSEKEQFILFLANHQGLQELKISGTNNLSVVNLIECIGSRLEKLKIEDEHLILSGQQLSVLLNRCPQLAHLHLHLSSLPATEGHNLSLTSLDISNCVMTMQKLSQFLISCPTLEQLQLQKVRLVCEKPIELARSLNVLHLKIEQTQISSLALSQLLLLLPRLNSLSLRRVVVKNSNAPFLFEGDCLADLERFSVTQVDMSQETIEQLMKNFKRLTSICLDYGVSSDRTIQSQYIISSTIVNAISSPYLREALLDFERINIDQLVELYLRNRQLFRLAGEGNRLLKRNDHREYVMSFPELLRQNKHLYTNIISSLFQTKDKTVAAQFAPPKRFSLDANTELPSQSPRDVMEYITPKPFGDNRYIHPRYYRETPFVITTINDGTVTFAEYVPTDITPYEGCRLINNAKQVYEKQYAFKDSIYLAEREYVLHKNEWQALTSCSPYEALMYLQTDVVVEIGFSQQIKKYYIRLNTSSNEDEAKVTVRHIFEALPLSEVEKIYDPDIDGCIHSLLFAPWGGYQYSEENIASQLRLMKLPPLERIGALLAFYDGHPAVPDSGFQAGTLQGTYATDIELVNAIKSQKLGRCELRLSPLYLDMQMLRMSEEHLIWTNAVHAFLETSLNDTIYHMDPGGLPLNLNLVKPSDYKAEALDMLEASERKRDIPQKVLQRQQLEALTDLGKDNPFITWKRGVKKEKELTVDEYISRLMQKTDGLSDKRRNVLVICEDSNQLELFNARLARYICQKQQKKYYYLSGYEGYSTSSIMITENGYEKTSSQLVDFVTSCVAEDIFCVNMSHIGTHYLWFIRLTEGNIGDYTLRQGQRVIMAIDKDSLPSIGRELYRRLDLVETMPSFPDGDLYNGCMRHYDAQNVPTHLDSFVRLYESPKAVESLKGAIHIDGSRLTLDQGPLIDAIKSGESNLYIQNAPFHLKAFREFLIVLCNTRELYHNKIPYRLPSSFYINHYDAPYAFNAHYSITPLDTEYGSSWSYPLNRTTWNLFFKTYYCDTDTSLMEERPGWLAQNGGQPHIMTILVTDDFPLNAWAEFIDAAKKYEVTLQFIVPPDISLPQPMSAAAQEHSNNRADKGKEKERPNRLVQLIVTDDVDFTFDHQIEHEPTDVVYHVTEASKYSDLFESFSADSDTLSFTMNQGYILQQLLNVQPSSERKRVILKGRLSKEFAQHLESLFSQNPCFYMNGELKTWPNELVIITDDKKSFPYFNVGHIQVAKEAYWERLNASFPELQKNVRQLEIACREIYKKTKIDFTYIQLKTMMQHLTNHPNSNPFLPVLRIFKEAKEAIEISKIHFPQQRGQFHYYTKLQDRRMAKLCQFLAFSYYAFVIGESGTAKTTTILTQLINFIKSAIGTQNVTLHVGLERLQDFLEQGGILYLDEANLKENGAYDIFENLFNDPPGIIVKGEFYSLNDRHRIIFSGNFTSYAHRKQHDFFARHGQVMLFKELRDDYLLENVLKPVFVNLFPDAPKEQDDTNQRIMVHLLSEYRRINALFAKPPLTPRNLQMMVLRFAVHVRQENIRTSFTIKQLMDLAINDELCGCTKEKDREGLPIWDEKALTRLKVCEHYLNENLIFKSSEYVLVPSRRNTLRLIFDAIQISRIKKENSYGIAGVLQEGNTTTGKSKTIIEALQQWGFVDGAQDTDNDYERHYYYIKGADYDEACRIFLQAFHEGAILVIDELNTIPGIEVLLNSFMSGYDLNGEPAKKPGFTVFATQNPILYMGRDILSDAVHKRFTEVDVTDYTREELIAIATGKGYEAHLVEHLVDQFLYAVNLAELEDVEQRPTLQKLLDVLESFQPLKPRQFDILSPDLFFSSGNRRAREENENQAEVLDDQGASKKSKGKEKEKEKSPDTHNRRSYGGGLVVIR